MNLNAYATRLADRLLADAAALGAEPVKCPSAARVADLTAGGLEAGRRLAEVCLADLGSVSFVPDESTTGVAVQVRTDRPVAACLASQYAGWKLTHESFFAMGSGPMRAAAGKEELFEKIGCRERAVSAVGVLETGSPPPPEVCREIAQACGVEPDRLTLLFAPTASQPGNVQIVARSVETALHKLVELGFDVSRIASGFGVAPLPPVAEDDLRGIGRTNDAILYGSRVTLWVHGDDASLEAIGPQVPSSASRDHGRPFAEIFNRYGGDFYAIDPLLFSPAVVTLVNLDSGRSLRFGNTEPGLLEASFTN